MSDFDGLAGMGADDYAQRQSASQGDHAKTVVFIAPPGRISHALTCAIEAEFPWLSVVKVASPAQMRKRPIPEAQLVVVAYRTYCKDKDALAEIARAHSHAGLALMVDTASDLPLHDLPSSLPLRGILPMDVNLDILLSILRIMVHGGSYLAPAFAISAPRTFPAEPSFAGRAALADGRTRAFPAQRQDAAFAETRPGSTLAALTVREFEVLHLVSRGCQNKVIASELRLSENTVKIHLHNIIRKLAVKNRTQAAALYLLDAGGEGKTSRPAAVQSVRPF